MLPLEPLLPRGRYIHPAGSPSLAEASSAASYLVLRYLSGSYASSFFHIASTLHLAKDPGAPPEAADAIQYGTRFRRAKVEVRPEA